MNSLYAKMGIDINPQIALDAGNNIKLPVKTVDQFRQDVENYHKDRMEAGQNLYNTLKNSLDPATFSAFDKAVKKNGTLIS